LDALANRINSYTIKKRPFASIGAKPNEVVLCNKIWKRQYSESCPGLKDAAEETMKLPKC
jgi:hypothetical protein